MIRLYNVIPDPLAELKDLKSEIWHSDRMFMKGKFYNVYAPSGKGKSTFVHVIYGIRKDFSGQIEINGKSVHDNKENDWADLRQKSLSIVFQDLRLFPALTSRENIRLKTELLPGEKHPEIQQLAELLGVNSLLDRNTNTLSYGERQRIAIIRALMQPFDMLLLDEPFSHLDKDNITKASGLIVAEAKKRNAGVVVTSLNPDDRFNYDAAYKL